MIVSHKYQFIFIKTAKTASTSIEVYLSRYCGEEDVLTPIFPEEPMHFPRNFESGGFRRHMPAEAVRRIVSREIWKNYFKFCVERNPWDRMLSHYHMINFRAGGTLTLDEYFERNKFCINYPKYMDHDDNVLVDRIIYYEELHSGLNEVFDQLGVPFDGDLGVRAKGDYRSDRRHYLEVYTPGQAQRISEVCAQEIRLHGYEY